MTFIRITTIGFLLLGTAVASSPAFAGFEFSGTGAKAASEAQAQFPEDSLDSPMPIVPTADVTAVPLDDMAGAHNDGNVPPPQAATPPDVDHVLKLPVSYQKPDKQQEVYIRRQHSAMMKAPKKEPVNTQALLKAVENSDRIELDAASVANVAPAAGDDANNDRLVINPYPLGDNEVASHGGGMGMLATEQAMMEQSGALRPVAVPGRKMPGMIERAKISSRRDSSSQYLERVPVQDDAAVFGIAPSMTPIPGGEGQPLAQGMGATGVPRLPDDPSYNSRDPAPSLQNDAGEYTQAIGFGRDLPLALALSQVVPPEYSYAFAENVDAGAMVSWQGGKPWNQVLDDMLKKQGLRAEISGKQVTIISEGRAA